MDRRPLVLCVALVASIATSPDGRGPFEPLFRGGQELAVGPFTLDAAHPERIWSITAELTLPLEADFEGTLGARVRFADTTPADPVTYRLTDCAGEALGVASVEWESSSVDIDDAFDGCVPETPCARTVCLEVATSNDQVAVDVEWTAFASVVAIEEVEQPREALEVPIEITIEDVAP